MSSSFAIVKSLDVSYSSTWTAKYHYRSGRRTSSRLQISGTKFGKIIFDVVQEGAIFLPNFKALALFLRSGECLLRRLYTEMRIKNIWYLMGSLQINFWMLQVS